MNKKWHQILSFLVMCAVFLAAVLPAFASDTSPASIFTIDEAYQYPVLPGTKEWQNLDTLEDKIEACHVDEELLASMTTSALLETVLTYPLFINIYAFGSVEAGMENMSLYFPGITLLAAREDANDCLLEYVQTTKQAREEIPTISNMNIRALSYYLGEHSGNESSDSYEDYPATKSTPAYVYTPKNHAVRVEANQTWDELGYTYAEALEVEQAYLGMYSIAKITVPNPTYNCHSYAWYSNEPSTNKYWMRDPSLYMTDGSYTQMSSPAVTYKVHRTTGNHSGIVGSATGVGGNPTIVSKWGALGVYWHPLLDCPYYGGVTYWTR